MSTATRLRKFRNSRVSRFRPSASLSLRELCIEKITSNLYGPHWGFWYKKLNKLAEVNSEYHGRPRQIRRGIFYANQAWFQPELTRTEASEFDILPLHPEYPELEVDAIKITANLSELDIETYEVKRFLAGLMLFPAPEETMSELLGSALYNRIGKFYAELTEENQGHVWNSAVCTAFHAYAEEHDHLITAMCQRVMMNLITQDAFREK